MTLSSTVMWLHRLNDWNTMPSSDRMRRICCSSAGRRCGGLPARRDLLAGDLHVVPLSGTSSMLMQRSSVDLPEPDEPISAIDLALAERRQRHAL